MKSASILALKLSFILFLLILSGAAAYVSVRIIAPYFVKYHIGYGMINGIYFNGLFVGSILLFWLLSVFTFAKLTPHKKLPSKASYFFSPLVILGLFIFSLLFHYFSVIREAMMIY